MKTKDLVRNKQWKTGSLYIPFKIAKLGYSFVSKVRT